LLVFGAVPLSACVSHNYAPGPGLSTADFGPHSARCHYLAENNTPGYSFGASGSLKAVAIYTAAAAITTGIDSAVRTSRNYDYCMQALGWQVADYGTPPVQPATSTSTVPVSYDHVQKTPRLAAAPLIERGSDLGRVTYQAVDQLLDAVPNFDPSDSLEVWSVSNSSRSVKPSQFDNIEADLVRGRLAQRGVSVFEFGARSTPMLVTIRSVAGENERYISLRLVYSADRRIISAVDYAVPNYPAPHFLPADYVYSR
jgi:hypothetical protein